VQHNCMRLLASMADQRVSGEEFTSTVAFILQQCVTQRTDTITRMLGNMQRASDDVMQAMVLKNIQVTHGRPRLRDRLHLSQAKRACMGTEGLQAFQVVVQFPSTVSVNTQLKAYMIASQTCIDKALAVSEVLPSELGDRVLQHSVASPDASIIKALPPPVYPLLRCSGFPGGGY
jgi:hypothetical protein